MEDIREKAIKKGRKKLKESQNRDKLIIKAVNFLDQSNNNFNHEMERFRDWYSLHFPELTKEITKDEHLIKILSNGVKRNEISSFESMAKESTGMPLNKKDIELLEESLEILERKLENREKIKKYVSEIADDEIPNLKQVLGPLLAARLISLTGGLEELAKKPASTVQMLGAEKALFRYLHGKGTPPKHGILFQHNFVNSLPEENRGKMARFLANKSVMAARLDQYGDKNKGEELREECQQRFEELKE